MYDNAQIIAVAVFTIFCFLMVLLPFLNLAETSAPLILVLQESLHCSVPFHLVNILGFFPFLFMMFFSTTMSPVSGVNGITAPRCLFSNFYFWRIVLFIKEDMEGCPDENVIIVYLMLSALIGLFSFLVVKQAYN